MLVRICGGAVGNRRLYPEICGLVADANQVTTTTTLSLTVNAARADLTPIAVSGSVGGGKRPKVSLSATIKNHGQIKAGGFAVAFYLSADDVVSSSDIALGSKSVNVLNTGALMILGGSYSIPAPTPPGDYRIGVIVDSTGLTAETGETNNALAGNTINITP